jgi:hypothetical protein
MSNAFQELSSITKIRSGNADRANKMALFVLLSLGLGAFNTLLLLLTTVNVGRVASRPTAALVQMSNGSTVEVKALEDRQRPPQLIKEFTATTITKLFTWQNYLPLADGDDARKPRLDPGVAIESSEAKVLVPTKVWGASFALEENFRKDFLAKSIGPLLTEMGIIQGKTEVALSILDLQAPIEIKSDRDEKLWKVNVVANLIVRSNVGASDRSVPFNKTIYLRAIHPSTVESRQPDSDLSKVVAIAQAAGLQIYGIEELSQSETKPLLPQEAQVSPAANK